MLVKFDYLSAGGLVFQMFIKVLFNSFLHSSSTVDEFELMLLLHWWFLWHVLGCACIYVPFMCLSVRLNVHHFTFTFAHSVVVNFASSSLAFLLFIVVDISYSSCRSSCGQMYVVSCN